MLGEDENVIKITLTQETAEIIVAVLPTIIHDPKEKPNRKERAKLLHTYLTGKIQAIIDRKPKSQRML